MVSLAEARALLRASTDATGLSPRDDHAPVVREALRALLDAVVALLPELAAMSRVASHRAARAIWLGLRTLPDASPEAPRLSLALHPDALVLTLGRGSPGRAPQPRPGLAWETQRRRALGDALGDRLSALRAAGATLHAHGRDPRFLAEDEWVAEPGGVVRFTLSSLDDDPGAVQRRAAERVARLLGFGALLGWVELAPVAPSPPSVGGWRAAVRALREDERAFCEASVPRDLVLRDRAYVYDPVTGWFAPERFVRLTPASVARERLLLDVGVLGAAQCVGRPQGHEAAPDDGLHARLGRWLAQRGVAAAQDEAVRATVFVPGSERVRAGDVPALEALLSRCLDDPSGDSAVALAALVRGAPWDARDPLDPRAVAASVPARFAMRAAQGHARLREHGLLVRGPVGGLGDVGVCLDEPVVSAVLVAAAARALGDVGVWEGHAGTAAKARSWEVSSPSGPGLERVARRLQAYARAAGLAFGLDALRALLVGLRVRPFAVLMGASGTGKTRLAQLVARFMTEALPARPGAARVAVVPVRPDWLDARGVLGFLNVLPGSGVYEDTAALRVILDAAAHPDEPHFLLLEEMNLARVEHYLAELLAAMEAGVPIPLHGRPGGIPSADGARVIPAEVYLPPNLFVLGTINVDETTHPFSAKVLDRAWCWEFYASPPSQLLGAWLSARAVTPAADAAERGALLGAGPVDDPVRALVLAMGRNGVGARIDRLFEALHAHGRPFGFRVVTELVRFVDACAREALEVPPGWALDMAVLGKLLPRLSGTRAELEPLLLQLLAVCRAEPVGGGNPSPGGLSEARDLPPEDLHATAARLRALLARLAREDFITFGG